jgi:hypothetical protein
VNDVWDRKRANGLSYGSQQRGTQLITRRGTLQQRHVCVNALALHNEAL